MRAAICILIVCLLGSCASREHGLFIKRKYNKGYYFSLTAHKKHSRSKETQRVEILPLKKEEIVMAVADPKIMIKPSLQTPVASSTLKYQHKIRSSLENSFAPIIHKQYSYKKGLRAKLQTSLKKNDDSDRKAGFKFAVYVVLFFVLAFIYTLVIKARNPSIPWALCIVVAMLGSLLTLLTGQLFV